MKKFLQVITACSALLITGAKAGEVGPLNINFVPSVPAKFGVRLQIADGPFRFEGPEIQSFVLTPKTLVSEGFLDLDIEPGTKLKPYLILDDSGWIMDNYFGLEGFGLDGGGLILVLADRDGVVQGGPIAIGAAANLGSLAMGAPLGEEFPALAFQERGSALSITTNFVFVWFPDEEFFPLITKHLALISFSGGEDGPSKFSFRTVQSVGDAAGFEGPGLLVTGAFIGGGGKINTFGPR